MSWRRIWIVAKFEFLAVVRRWSFLIATLLVPLVLGGALVLVGAFQATTLLRQASAPRSYAVVDGAGIFAARAEPPDGFELLPNEARARDEVKAGKLSGYFVLPRDYLQDGKVVFYALPEPLGGLSNWPASERLEELLREELLGEHLEGALRERVLNPLKLERRELVESPEAGAAGEPKAQELARLVVPLLSAFLLMMGLMSTSSYLLLGLAAEKESKVVEVLLACARADEIFAGKLLGLGACGLLQLGLWGALLSGVVAAGQLATGLFLPWQAVLSALVFLPLGYLFIGSLMLTTGSLGTNARESQQYAMIWASPVMVPLMLAGVLVSEPHGLLAQLLSWIPFTAPGTLVLRLSLDSQGVAWFELLGPFALLCVATAASVVFGARLFRMGLLLEGRAFSWSGLGQALRGK
jgi:ABC-2 type transport system permease protein